MSTTTTTAGSDPNDELQRSIARLTIAISRGDVNGAFMAASLLAGQKPLLTIVPTSTTDSKTHQRRLDFIGSADDYGFLESAGFAVCTKAYEKFDGNFGNAVTYLSMSHAGERLLLSMHSFVKQNARR